VAGTIAEEVAERARRFGPLRFDEVLDLALYHPEHGFYASGSGAGRDDADFLTSPEVGPVFGTVLARALDAWWDELGNPDPYVVVDAGAGPGTLAASVLAARPRCSLALRYVLVERSDRWRERHGRRVPLEPAAMVLGPVVADDPEEGPEPQPGLGPLATSLAELPAGPFDGVIVANELLDNLAFRWLERAGDASAWLEVRVTAGLEELLVEAPADVAAEAELLAPSAPARARIPIQHRAQAWLRSALDSLARGRVVVVDYADTTPGMAARPWTEWVRTFRQHGRGDHPLIGLGRHDVTCDVAVDQLAHVAAPVTERSQAAFLAAHGLDDVVAEARRRWQERAHVGDLEALRAKSTVNEAAALTDPTGLGAFRVLEWVVGGAARTSSSVGSRR
jgi:SAM-dependent MidA family methyltransferase